MKSIYPHSAEYKIKLAGFRVKAFQDLTEAHTANRKIIFIDETLFKAYSITAKSWAKKGFN